MKHNTLKLWLIAAVFFITPQIVQPCAITQDCSTSCNDLPCSKSKNFWAARPFSSYASREITLEKTVFQTESAREEWNGTFSFATEYMQNFGGKSCNCKNLGSMPFWGQTATTTCTNSMTIGNNVNPDYVDVDAWNFGLGNLDNADANGVSGTITLNPKITHVGTDFMLYFVHKKDEPGLYFKIHAPLGAMTINPQLCETGDSIIDVNSFSQTTTGSVAITYNTTYPSLHNRYQSMSSAFAGGLVAEDVLNGHNLDQLYLNYGKISPCKQTVIALADLSVVLGVNVAANEKGFLGIGFKATCPTGNVPNANYMLEPVFGRGGLWGVGADVMGHYKAWESEDGEKYLDIWMQGDVLHLMPGRTPSMRTFDLALNGKGSKYSLLQYFKYNPDGTTTADFLTQAANITTLPVYSKFAVEGAFALMADYHHNDWNFAISGEFWGRSKECLSINTCATMAQNRHNLNDFGVVGRQASAFNVLTNAGATVPGTIGLVQSVVPLVQPAAKINSAENTITLVGGSGALPTFPAANANGSYGANSNLFDGRVAANRIPEDVAVALDICGAAAARAFTGKVFSQLGYTWNEARYTPNISFIGGAEFTSNTNNSVQFWSAGLQGSINF